MQNPNCDGSHCTSDKGEVRVLPTGGQSNAILCRSCFEHDKNWRRKRNKELSAEAAFPIVLWEILQAYNPGN